MTKTATKPSPQKISKASDNDLDEKLVRQLATILDETGLTEIEYEKAECRIRVARQVTVSAALPAVMPAVSGAPVSAPAPIAATPAEINIADHPGALKSPMVGNAYLSAAPGSAPFVKVGDTIKAGDTILIIEAMKVMNQIKSPKAGVLKEILVQDTDPVEFDQVLAIIE